MQTKLLEYNLVSRYGQMSVCLLKAAKEAALEATFELGKPSKVPQ